MRIDRCCVFLCSIAGVALSASAAVAEAVPIAPPEGTTTNVLSLFTGGTAVEVRGPGTTKLNPANSHDGGTTLSGGTLVISGNFTPDGRSPVGIGTFTVSGGTLRGSGTFGGNITGTGEFNIEAPDGWTWTGDNTFDLAVTLADGNLTIADGATTFSDNLWLGVGGSDVSFTMTGGSITMDDMNPQFSPKKYAKSRFTMTGGTFNANGRNVLTGYKTTYATNTFDVSGSAVFYNAGNVYTYSGNGNVMNINVHDGGTLDCSAIYNGNNTAGTAKTNLRVDGGILRCNKKGSSATSVAAWIGNSDAGRQLTSFTIGPKGATFMTDNGDASGVMQIYSPVTAEPAGAGETAAGVTISGGRFAYYLSTAYEGPTIIRDGATLYLVANGTIPSGSAVAVNGGSMLRLQGANKTISSLTLEEGAALGFGTPSSGANSDVLTVSGSVTLPSRAQIALYTLDTPAGVAKNANGTYAVLTVSAAHEAALRAVHWSCATATSGKAYTFSVATSGDWATLSMTIADDPNAGADSIAGTSTLNADNYAVASDITINNSGTLVAKKNIYGSAIGGSITINDGGTLDASAGNIRPVNASGNSFHLYLNDGGTLIVNQIHGDNNSPLPDEANATPMFHFNGGTIYPVAFEAVDGNRFLLNYQTAVVGENGMTVDLTRWECPAGYTQWVRSSIQGNINHDPNCVGVDGGITIRGVKGERAVVLLGSRFAGSTLTGGIHVEDGATLAVHRSALVGQAITFAPGSRFRPYDNTSTINIGNMTLGASNATEPVAFDGSNNKAGYNIAVTDSINVLSPVVFSTCSAWNRDSSPASGIYTALVYKASCSVDPSLFQLPAGSAGTLAASEVTLSGGDYDGWKALVVTIDNDIVVTGAAEYPSPKTVSSDVSCGNIVVGGSWNGVADPVCESSLTVSGNVTASEGLYLGYNPAPGVDKDNWHQGFLTLNGGSITTPLLYSIYRPGMTGTGDVHCRFGCEATVNGGLLDVAGDVRLGYNRSRNGNNLYSQLAVNGGRVAVGGQFYLLYDDTKDAYTAPGSIVLNDGEVDVKGLIDMTRNVANPNNTVYAEKFGIWLNGGVLKAENIMMTATKATSPQLVFNGGTYAPYGSTEESSMMQNLARAYVSTNGAIISTENVPADGSYCIDQPLLTDPALNGARDGGLTKRGAGWLVLGGANTYTGPTKVEEGTLVLDNEDAISERVEVSDGAVLDVGDGFAISEIAASGAVQVYEQGSLRISKALLVVSSGSILSVDGNVVLGRRTAVDFGLVPGDSPDDAWRPVLAASGNIDVPNLIRARNCGGFRGCETMVQDGVLYVRPTVVGMTLHIR